MNKKLMTLLAAVAVAALPLVSTQAVRAQGEPKPNQFGGLTNSTSRHFGSMPPNPTHWAKISITPRRLQASTSMPSSRISRRS